MSSTNRTVVVTGIGATTPLGGDVASTWEGLVAGRSGVKPLEQDWAAEQAVKIAAPVAVEPTEVIPRPQARRLDRSAQFALVAAKEAWADAGFEAKAGEDPAVDPDRLGAVIASGIGGVTTLLDQYDVLKEKGVRRVSPHTVPMLMPNSPSANVGLAVGARAGVHTPVSACASGAEAIGYAIEMIRTGRADVVVAGGTEAAIHPLPIAAFGNMMAMSKNNDDPQGASRPYDVARDGFVLGEGAGVVVVPGQGAEGQAVDEGGEGGLADVGAVAVSDLDDVEGLEGFECLADGVAADAEVLHEFGFGGQRRAGGESAVEDELHDLALYPAGPGLLGHAPHRTRPGRPTSHLWRYPVPDLP